MKNLLIPVLLLCLCGCYKIIIVEKCAAKPSPPKFTERDLQPVHRCYNILPSPPKFTERQAPLDGGKTLKYTATEIDGCVVISTITIVNDGYGNEVW